MWKRVKIVLVNGAAILYSLFNAWGKEEFGQDLRCLGILEAHRQKGHILSGIQCCVLRRNRNHDQLNQKTWTQ